MHIVKKEERDKKARFSVFEIELKDGVDVSYPGIQLTKNKKKTRIDLVYLDSVDTLCFPLVF